MGPDRHNCTSRGRFVHRPIVKSSIGTSPNYFCYLCNVRCECDACVPVSGSWDWEYIGRQSCLVRETSHQAGLTATCTLLPSSTHPSTTHTAHVPGIYAYSVVLISASNAHECQSRVSYVTSCLFISVDLILLQFLASAVQHLILTRWRANSVKCGHHEFADQNKLRQQVSRKTKSWIATRK